MFIRRIVMGCRHRISRAVQTVKRRILGLLFPAQAPYALFGLRGIPPDPLVGPASASARIVPESAERIPLIDVHCIVMGKARRVVHAVYRIAIPLRRIPRNSLVGPAPLCQDIFLILIRRVQVFPGIPVIEPVHCLRGQIGDAV